MSEKLEQIKQLQQELFVEEYGVTKEQAIKLNEFLFYESLGKEYDPFCGEVTKPSVSEKIARLRKRYDEQQERLSELEWEHKKLWVGTWLFGIVAVVTFICVIWG